MTILSWAVIFMCVAIAANHRAVGAEVSHFGDALSFKAHNSGTAEGIHHLSYSTVLMERGPRVDQRWSSHSKWCDNHYYRFLWNHYGADW